MSSKCIKRLQQELKDMRINKASNAEAAPDESDLLTWYYVLEGPKDTPYEGGEYLGRIKIPNNYPFSPPSYFICTPNGRFQTETSICTSFSSYHADQWTPAWNMSTILQGLLSFMVENATTAGSITTDDATKKALAQASHQFNVKQARYRTLFPERYNRALTKVEEMNAEKEKKKKKEEAAALAAQNEKTFSTENNNDNNDIPQQLANNNTNLLLNNNNNNTNQNRNKNNSGYLENKKVAYLMLAVTVGAAIAAKFL